MELVSKTIKRETSTTPYSTLVSRYTKWFDDRYVEKKIDDLPEKKEDIVLVPGKIYTFSYDPITKDQMQFFSYMPINLILGYKISEAGNMIPYGINLSFIPPSVRIMILDSIIRVWGNNIMKNNEELIDKGLPTQSEIPMDYDAAKKLLEGSGWEFAIRGYRYDHMRSLPQIVSPRDWHKICYFSIKFIAKMQIRAIYRLYAINANPNYRIGKKYDINIQQKKLKELRDYFKKRGKY